MSPDDPVCLCFHVSRRKVTSFIRVEKPRLASQLSECFGAGTGCGWCRPFLKRLLAEQLADQSSDGQPVGSGDAIDELSPVDYARQRAEYVRRGGGTPPPGAAPIDPDSPPASGTDAGASG